MSSAPGGGIKRNGHPKEVRLETSTTIGSCGMWVLLATLSVLFAASLILLFIFKSRAPEWPPPGLLPLPDGLWVTTLLLIASSGTMHWALHCARSSRKQQLSLALLLTWLLGAAFLALQLLHLFGWAGNAASSLEGAQNLQLLYKVVWFMICLHGAHVVGGLIPLGAVVAAAFRGVYSSHGYLGVRMVSFYWHFLDVVWLVLFVSLNVAL